MSVDQGIRILLVEDAKVMRKLERKTLNSLGFENINEAEDGNDAITKLQKDLLNPTQKQVIKGFILYDVKGKGAREKVARRRLDMVSGNVSSYSRVLNDPKLMQEYEEVNKLVATVAAVSADKEAAKERTKEAAELTR